VRIDFFGDEIESIRKFEPESQRSSTPLDEALLLPLTETPVSEKLLAAVHARLSRSRLQSNEEAAGQDEATDLVTRAVAAGGVTVFPGWEFFAPVAGADRTLFDLLRNPQIFVEEPAMLQNQAERWWNKVEQRHERAGIGGLITAADIYLNPWELKDKIARLPGLELDQLGAVDVLDEDVNAPAEVDFPSRPTLRFHGSIPAFVEQLKSLAAQEHRVIIAAPNQGEVERLANLLREYGLAYRLGSRTQHTGSETIYDESSYLGGDMRTPIIVRTAIANGVSFPDAKLVVIGANDLSDDADVAARPLPTRSKSKTAAFVSDFRDLAVGDYVVHVEHGIGRYHGLKEIQQDGLNVEFMVLEFADNARLYVPLTRLDLIQKYRSTDAGPAPVLNKLGGQQWAKTKARVKKAMADMADELLKLYAQRRAAEGHPFPPDRRPAFGHRGYQARYGIQSADGSPAVRRCGLRQDGSRHACSLQGGAGRKAGGCPDPHHRAQLPALRNLPPPFLAVPHQHRDDLPLPHAERAEDHSRKTRSGPDRHPDRHPSAPFERPEVPGHRPAGGRRGAALRRPP
jgi:transcription-repair coupling factor (superfamily II helicase)